MTVLALDSLPAEILDKIFSHLPCDTTLLQVALVCQQFRIAMRPLQYRTIKLSLKPKCKHKDRGNSIRENIYKFHDLFKILSADSTLRDEVRSLFIDVWHHPWYERFEDQHRLVEILPRLRTLHLGPPPPKLNLSNHLLLESLSLDFSYLNPSYDEDLDREKISSLEYLSRYLWHPPLRSLETQWLRLSDPNSGNYLPKGTYRSSPVIDLRLMSCFDVDLGACGKIIHSIRALQSLTLEVCCQWEVEHTRTYNMSPPEIGRIITHHADTLVELIVAGSNAGSFLPSRFGTFAHFRSLQRLGIPEHFLVNEEDIRVDHLLPSTLTVLQMQYPMGLNSGKDDERPHRVLRQKLLAAHRQQRCPSLERVIWWEQQWECWSGTRYGPSSDMEEIRLAFQQVDVIFEFLSSPFFDDTPLAMERTQGPRRTDGEDAPSAYRLDLEALYKHGHLDSNWS